MSRFLVCSPVYLLSFLLYCSAVRGQSVTANILEVKTVEDLHSFFRYTEDRVPFVGAHRGGAMPGFPENAIRTFENTLRLMPAFFEVDPRLTKDSVVVVIHDKTLDRTTTGSGLVADHTWEELQKLRLKDPEGTVTDDRIHSLQEVLEWARDKTVIMLDKKDVPLPLLLKEITKAKAESYVLISTYAVREAVYYHNRNPNLMFEAFIFNMDSVRAYEHAGIPWENIVAYVSKNNDPGLFDALHQRNVMTIFYTARGIERIPDPEKRKAAYQAVVRSGADIILCDNVVEVEEAIVPLRPSRSTKYRFFGKRVISE